MRMLLRPPGGLILITFVNQKLDTKTLQRLETAVFKSEYSQGKKLKVVPKVCDCILSLESDTNLIQGELRHCWWTDRGNR